MPARVLGSFPESNFMQSNQIYRTRGGSGVKCLLQASAGSNAETLRPLAQMVQRLEAARKAASFRTALAERCIDADLEITFETGNTVRKKFRDVYIDLAPGRDPRLVLESKPDGETVSVQFTAAVAAEWLNPGAKAGCLDCGGKYICPVCAPFKEPLAA